MVFRFLFALHTVDCASLPVEKSTLEKRAMCKCIHTGCIHTGCIHRMYSHSRKRAKCKCILLPRITVFLGKYFLGSSLQWFDGKISTPFTQSLWGSLLKNLTKLFCPVCFVLSWNGFSFLVCFVLYFLKWVRCKTQFAAHFGWDPVLDFLQNAIKIHLIAAG